MINVKPMTGAVGAEIEGVDLKLPIDDALAETLRKALASHGVIVFRDQHLGLPCQKRLTRVFGDIMKLPYVEPIDDDPEVIAVLKEAEEHKVGVFGGDWHSDMSFLENPPAGSVLNAVEVPEFGGDTVWASQVAAYEALPDALREMVDGRDAVHVGKPYGVKYAPPMEDRVGGSVRMIRDDPNADKEIRHPCVVSARDGARKALFVNPIYTTRLDGMSDDESAPILEALYKHCVRPDFCCRLRWTAGTIAVWDNRATMHYAVNDYDGVRRLLYRTTFAGPRPSK